MFPKHYINSSITTPLPTQKVATCQIKLHVPKGSQYCKRAHQSSTTTFRSSSEMDKLRRITNTAYSLVNKITVMGTSFISREFERWNVATD